MFTLRNVSLELVRMERAMKAKEAEYETMIKEVYGDDEDDEDSWRCELNCISTNRLIIRLKT